jgi:uncharacterized Zn finger protein (UPF0148 family)
MPIRLQCTCKKTLTVKDEFAGKSVKCPGCQKVLRVPASGNPAVAVSSPRPAAGGAPQTSRAAAPSTGLDDLFEEEGLQQVVGPTCPVCGKPLKSKDSVLCTHCGTNLQTGQKVVGHSQAAANKPTLGHRQLDEAVEMMKTDAEMQARTTNVGMPWWFLTIMLLFIGAFSFGLITIVNAGNAGTETTGLAKTIKEYAANQTVVWGCIITGLAIQGIARLWIVIVSFMEGVGEGLVALFLYHKFLAQLFESPVIALIYTLGFFTTLSGFGLMAANYFGGSG